MKIYFSVAGIGFLILLDLLNYLVNLSERRRLQENITPLLKMGMEKGIVSERVRSHISGHEKYYKRVCEKGVEKEIMKIECNAFCEVDTSLNLKDRHLVTICQSEDIKCIPSDLPEVANDSWTCEAFFLYGVLSVDKTVELYYKDGKLSGWVTDINN